MEDEEDGEGGAKPIAQGPSNSDDVEPMAQSQLRTVKLILYYHCIDLCWNVTASLHGKKIEVYSELRHDLYDAARVRLAGVAPQLQPIADAAASAASGSGSVAAIIKVDAATSSPVKSKALADLENMIASHTDVLGAMTSFMKTNPAELPRSCHPALNAAKISLYKSSSKFIVEETDSGTFKVIMSIVGLIIHEHIPKESVQLMSAVSRVVQETSLYPECIVPYIPDRNALGLSLQTRSSYTLHMLQELESSDAFCYKANAFGKVLLGAIEALRSSAKVTESLCALDALCCRTEHEWQMLWCTLLQQVGSIIPCSADRAFTVIKESIGLHKPTVASTMKSEVDELGARPCGSSADPQKQDTLVALPTGLGAAKPLLAAPVVTSPFSGDAPVPLRALLTFTPDAQRVGSTFSEYEASVALGADTMLGKSSDAKELGLAPNDCSFILLKSIVNKLQDMIFDVSMFDSNFLEHLDTLEVVDPLAKQLKLQATKVHPTLRMYFGGEVSPTKTPPCFLLGKVFGVDLYLNRGSSGQLSDYPCPAWLVPMLEDKSKSVGTMKLATENWALYLHRPRANSPIVAVSWTEPTNAEQVVQTSIKFPFLEPEESVHGREGVELSRNMQEWEEVKKKRGEKENQIASLLGPAGMLTFFKESKKRNALKDGIGSDAAEEGAKRTSKKAIGLVVPAHLLK